MCFGFSLPFNFKRKRHNCYNCGVVVFCHSCSRRRGSIKQGSLEDDKRVEICRSSKKDSSRVSPFIPNGGLQWEALNISESFDPVFGSSNKSNDPVFGSSNKSNDPVFGSSNKSFSPKILVDDTNDSLSQQEVIKLRAKVENLTCKAQLQEVELERTKNQLKEAIAIAEEKTAECNEAKDVIKSLTAQVAAVNDESYAKRSKQDEDVGKEESEPKAAGDENQKQNKGESLKPPEPPKDYIHVRARRGQATESLAARVRREKISERMKFLQDLVPGCNKVIGNGKAVVLDEITKYVQSLQHQVEFLSMKLATVNPRMDFNMDVVSKDIFQSRGALSHTLYPLDSAMPVFPYGYQSQQVLPLHSISNGTETQFPVNSLNAELRQNPIDGFGEATPQLKDMAENIKSPSLASFGSSPASNEVSNASIDRMNGQATFQEPDSNGSISQLLSNVSSTNSNRRSGHNKQPHSDATSRNGNRIKDSESCNDAEWVEQDEPGVYITLTSLPGGIRDLKRVRFSKRQFSENQAEHWWAENRARVYEQYNVHMIDKSSAGVGSEDVMNSDEQPSRSNSEKENTLRRST